jgi:hypothetical protein
MAPNDRHSSIAPLVIIGFMTASRRIRAVGGIFALILLSAGFIWRWMSMGDPDRNAWIPPVAVICLGGFLVFYWIVAVILAWLGRIVAEDMSED